MAKPNKNTTKVENTTNVENTTKSENTTKVENTTNVENTKDTIVITSENTSTDVLTDQIAIPEISTTDINTGAMSISDMAPVSNTTPDSMYNPGPSDDPSDYMPAISGPGIDINTLLKTIQDLSKEVQDLKAEKNSNNASNNTSNAVTQQPYQASQTVVPVPVPVNGSNTTSEMSQILNHLINKKSDKEVTIVHNQERIGGLSTAIRLTGVSIDFHKKGEVATLSWQQFEECVSRYRSWFDKKIVLLSYEDRELADRYHVPFLGQDGLLVLTRDQLLNSGKLTGPQLEDLYTKLCPEDQENLCTHWIGKCYEKAPGFYDLYKVEILNRLSRKGAFDNILVAMRNDTVRNSITPSKATGVPQMGVVTDTNVSQPQMGVVTNVSAPQMGVVY